jgi:hypothetical protein
MLATPSTHALSLAGISSDRHRRPAETRIRRPGRAADTRTLDLHAPRRRDTIRAPDTIQIDTAGHIYGGLNIQQNLERYVPSVMPAAAAHDTMRYQDSYTAAYGSEDLRYRHSAARDCMLEYSDPGQADSHAPVTQAECSHDGRIQAGLRIRATMYCEQ